MSKAKIICTLGPASDRPGILLKMIRAGMDVARLNFSHGNLTLHQQRINLVHRLNRQYNCTIKILGDLEGYRIRVGRLKNGTPLRLEKHQAVWLTPQNILGEKNLIPFDYDGPLDKIRNGQVIYIDDGTIALKVLARQKCRIKAVVDVGGRLKEHKGINMPGVTLDFQGLTAKDKEDIRFCARNRLDCIAQSFVRSKKDILVLRDFLKQNAYRCKLIAKIENRQGIRRIDEIIGVSSGIMVARGDMGVSIPIYEVPVVQKQIIGKCNRRKRFVITATQMLESMTENRIPTRAEVSDVANAILDGSGYVMLSAETAVGAYPVEAVDMMDKIIAFTEKNKSSLGRRRLDR